MGLIFEFLLHGPGYQGRNEDEGRSEDVRVSLEQGRLALETAELISAKENKAFFPFFLLLSEPTLILYHEVKGNSGSDTQVSQYDGYHGYGAFVS